MSGVPFVVFDTSTLVSAALRPNSKPALALSKALATGILCASLETLQELESVLQRDKFDAYLDRSMRLAFIELVKRRTQLFAPDPSAVVNPPCRDLNDNKFLALAQHINAARLVSSDDLLILSPWNEIPIVTPANYLDSLP